MIVVYLVVSCILSVVFSYIVASIQLGSWTFSDWSDLAEKRSAMFYESDRSDDYDVLECEYSTVAGYEGCYARPASIPLNNDVKSYLDDSKHNFDNASCTQAGKSIHGMVAKYNARCNPSWKLEESDKCVKACS